MKCVLCDQKKGKRYCPAKSGLICAQCCGEKRVLVLDCPESCEYLKIGREHEMKDYGKRLQNLEPQAREQSRRVLTDYQNVVAHLEYTLSRERLLSRNLTDNDVALALDILLATYKTEDNGVLYEKTSEDLTVESLRRELRKVIESYRNPEGKEEPGIVDAKSSRLALRSAIECLEFLRIVAATYLEERDSQTGYVDFLARVTPRESSQKQNSIIMP
jgi:hypothetical protein